MKSRGGWVLNEPVPVGVREQRPPKILVVDDSVPNILLMGRALEGLGTIRFATSGADALRLAEQEPPDLVMLDIEMPGMSGYEVCRRLKADSRCRDGSIIFVTAHDIAENEPMSFAAGGVDFLAKPFSTAICRLRAHNQLLLKQRTDSLRRARADFEDLMVNLPALVAYWDESLCNLYSNDTEGRWFGISAMALRGEPIECLLPPAAATAARAAMSEALQQKPSMIELSIDDTASPRRVMQLAVVPSRRSADRQGVLTLFTDISDLKAAQEQLSLLATSVAHLNDVVMITEGGPLEEPGPRIVFVNEAFERSTGYSRDEVIGRSPRFLQGPLTDRDALARVGDDLRAWRPSRVELVNYDKHGRAYWVEMEIIPIPDERGGIAHWVAIERDVTARREAAAKLLEANQQLEQRVSSRTREFELAKEDAERANREKSEYLTNISHELRSPLHSILGFTKLLVEDQAELEPERVGHFLGRVQDNAETLLALVNDLLDSAKLETGKVTLNHSELSPRELYLPLVQEFATLCRRRRVQLNVDDRLPAGLRVEADPLRLVQALRNVLANAIRFSPDGSRVDLRIEADDARWQLSVSDQGVGIPPSELDSIFERFTQSSSTKTGAGGTGLGLPIARGIVELHGGRLWAEGNQPHGARFVFRLPLRRPPGETLQ